MNTRICFFTFGTGCKYQEDDIWNAVIKVQEIILLSGLTDFDTFVSSRCTVIDVMYPLGNAEIHKIQSMSEVTSVMEDYSVQKRQVA